MESSKCKALPVLIAAAVALMLTNGCTSLPKSTAHYQREMEVDDRAPASVNGAGENLEPALAKYACKSAADASKNFELRFGAKQALITLNDGTRGALYDAQSGEVSVAPGNETLAVDGLGDANTYYYLSLPKIEEFPAQMKVALITKPGGQAQTEVAADCRQ